jgi:mevalonate kinase
LTRRGAVALAENNLLELGKCMSAAQTNLAALGVSTTQIDKLVRAAMQAGALGAKLTGSGMGGCVIAIAPTAEIAEQVADAMSSAGAIQVWQHEFA